MENMGAVPVYGNAVHVLSIGIAAHMAAPVNHQHPFAGLLRFMGKHRTKQSGADNQVVVCCHVFPSLS